MTRNYRGWYHQKYFNFNQIVINYSTILDNNLNRIEGWVAYNVDDTRWKLKKPSKQNSRKFRNFIKNKPKKNDLI